MDILPQLLINSMITGSIYALVCCGISLVYGLLRILNFAHGHILMLGAYSYYLCNNTFGINFYLSFLLSFIFIAIFAAFTFKVFINPFLNFNPILVFVTTLALSIMLESLVSIGFGVNVKSLDAGELLNSVEIGSVYITPIQMIIIASALLLLTLVAFVIHKTVTGRLIRALSENSPAGQSLGINSHYVYYGVFIFGSLVAAFSGIMLAYETNLQPLMGNSYTIKAFAAMILGGLGNLWGTIIGAFLLGLVENLSIGLDFGGYSLPAGYKDAFAFLIILVILIIRPQGLFGRTYRKA